MKDNRYDIIDQNGEFICTSIPNDYFDYLMDLGLFEIVDVLYYGQTIATENHVHLTLFDPTMRILII